MRETGHSGDGVRTMEDDGGVDGVKSSHLLGCCAVGHASGGLRGFTMEALGVR